MILSEIRVGVPSSFLLVFAFDRQEFEDECEEHAIKLVDKRPKSSHFVPEISKRGTNTLFDSHCSKVHLLLNSFLSHFCCYKMRLEAQDIDLFRFLLSTDFIAS